MRESAEGAWRWQNAEGPYNGAWTPEKTREIYLYYQKNASVEVVDPDGSRRRLKIWCAYENGMVPRGRWEWIRWSRCDPTSLRISCFRRIAGWMHKKDIEHHWRQREKTLSVVRASRQLRGGSSDAQLDELERLANEFHSIWPPIFIGVIVAVWLLFSAFSCWKG